MGVKYFLDREGSLWAQKTEETYTCVTEPYKETSEAWGPLTELVPKGSEDVDSEEPSSVVTERDVDGTVVVTKTYTSGSASPVIGGVLVSYTASGYPTGVVGDPGATGVAGVESTWPFPPPEVGPVYPEPKSKMRKKNNTSFRQIRKAEQDRRKQAEGRIQRPLIGFDPAGPAESAVVMLPDGRITPVSEGFKWDGSKPGASELGTYRALDVDGVRSGPSGYGETQRT